MTFVLVLMNTYFFIMNDLKRHYENSKTKAKQLMKKGQIGAYVNALLEMNHYKKLMVAVDSN